MTTNAAINLVIKYASVPLFNSAGAQSIFSAVDYSRNERLRQSTFALQISAARFLIAHPQFQASPFRLAPGTPLLQQPAAGNSAAHPPRHPERSGDQTRALH